MSVRELLEFPLRFRLPLILCILIVFLSVISLLFRQNVLTSKPVTLNILMEAIEAPFWRELIEEFEEKYQKKIHIQLIEGSDATDIVEKTYVEAFKQEESNSSKPKKKFTSILQDKHQHYDLVYMDIIWVPSFADKGWLVDLSKLISEKELEKLKADFLPKDWEGGFYKDGLYRIPFHSDLGMLYYRKDVLTEPPKTFNELMKFSQEGISQEVKKKNLNISGYVWQGQPYEGLVAMFLEVLKGYGGFWIENPENPKTFQVGLDKDEAFNAVQFLHETIAKKITPKQVTTYTERETASVFQNGEAVFMRNWPYVWLNANAAGSEIRNKFDITSMVHEENHSSGACQGGWGLGIASSSKHRHEAWEAIQFFTNTATQRKYAMKTGNMPSRRSLFNDPQLVKRYSYFPKLLKVSEDSVLRPKSPDYTQVSQILQTHLSCVLKKDKITLEEIKTEMRSAADQTRQRLKVGSQQTDNTKDEKCALDPTFRRLAG